MSGHVVVTGASGHLGNNLVRALLARGEDVVAATRADDPHAALAGLPCRVARVELRDADALARVFAGAATVYLAGAVFKHWARNPLRDIYAANLEVTQAGLDAAARSGAGRVVYISSMAAADRSRLPATERGWNAGGTNVYIRSKTDSERLAWALARRHGSDMVSMLPGAMVGPRCYRDTPTMALLRLVAEGKLVVDPGLYFSFVDVREVAQACIRAAKSGRPGERYLLANEACTSVRELAAIARRCLTHRRIPEPRVVPRSVLWLAASAAELWAVLTGMPPALQRSVLSAFSVQEHCDIGKARRELGFMPTPPSPLLEDVLSRLGSRPRYAAFSS